MAQGITTSIRLPSQISRQLGRLSRKLKKGKNGVIIDALLDYFHRVEKTSLKDEAVRQSLLVSRSEAKDESKWEENLDCDDWKR